MFITYLQLGIQSLKRQKGRTILTMVALSIGIASVVIILSAGKGLEGMILGELDVYNPNVVNVEVRVPGKGNTGSVTSMASGVIITTLKNKDLDEVRKLDKVEAVSGYVTGQEILKYKGEDKITLIFGYSADSTKTESISIKSGRFYTNEEEDSLQRVVVIGSKIKDYFFGDDEAVGKSIYVRNKAFKVVGVVDERGGAFGFDYDELVYLPLKTIQKRLLGTDYMIGMNVLVNDGDRINQVKEEIELLLMDRHDITDTDKQDFEAMTMAEAREMLQVILDGITILLVALVCISLLVGGVGITNIMYVTVAERTFEVGLRKAVGAKSKDVLWQFLFEAIMLTLGGGILGIILGILFSFLIYLTASSYGLDWVFSISIFSIILALGFSGAVGLFFGVYPAKKAASLDPITALRKE